MFTTDEISKLEKIVGGDDILEEVFESLRSISENSEIISKYENDEIFKSCFEIALNENRRQGIDIGINQGINDNKVYIIKNLLSKNTKLNIISEIIGISIEEVEKIIKENKELKDIFDAVKNKPNNIMNPYENDEIFQSCYKIALNENRRQGIDEGINEEKNNIAKNLLNKKMDLKTISEVTGLTVEEVEELV